MSATTLTRVETELLRVPFGTPRGGSGATQVEVVLVTVTDADGATGTGFSYALGTGGAAIRAIVDTVCREHAVGADHTAWDPVWESMCAATSRLGRGVSLPAISAVDIAVWDLRARAAGMALYRFIGAHRDAIEVYGSGRATNQMTVEELVEGTRGYVAEGYRAVKLRAGGRPVEEDLARISAVREAVGPGVRLMVDVNERLRYPDALWLGHGLRELGVYWFEEPLSSADVAGHRRLADALGIAIAVGEHLQGRFEFAEYLRQHAASVLMPDAPLVGGVTEFLRIATVAEALGATVAPHFLPELHLHLGLATKAATYVEHFPLLDDLYDDVPPIHDGRMRASDRPGHGIRFAEDARERFRVAT